MLTELTVPFNPAETPLTDANCAMSTFVNSQRPKASLCYVCGMFRRILRSMPGRLATALLLTFCALDAQAPRLVNPLLPSGPDPWITSRDGFYYFMSTTAHNLTIRKTARIEDLAHAAKKVVWRAPETGPDSHDVWAPELHFLRGKWYIYFAADAGSNASHRLWVVENEAADPLQGDWRMKGKLADPGDHWAIDPTVFEQSGRLYIVWSGWEGDRNGTQNLYIAELSDPWTMKGPRVKISTPEYPWEKVGDLNTPRDPPHIDVNEGPEIIRHGGRIFLIYSASGCWTDAYTMGMLTANESADLLNPASWKKDPQPAFRTSPDAGAYGPGHGSFFRSPDGKEDWMLYHANPEPHQGCRDSRSPRAQRFTWKADGTPDFGRPVGIGLPIAPPSGENE
jgi:GH43 family beta-xylosidase